jgi:DNA-directed RNA polymerase subunit alpha
MKWKNLRMPDEIVWNTGTMNDRYGELIAEPLERGYGVTIGNALRRVLLSSLQGAAVTAVRFRGVLHEFSVVPGVMEDVTELILNIKQLNLTLKSDGPETLILAVEGPGEVTAALIDPNPNVEIMNTDLHIATLNDESSLEIEIIVDSGRGYVQAEEHEFEEQPIGFIPVDSVFSPVRRVHYDVENTRVGQRTDYDKLTLEVWTDGTVTPEDAVSFSAKMLKDHLLLFMSFDIEPQEEVEEEIDEEQMRLMELLDHSVEELELSVRSSNCLRDAGIRTLGDLVQKTEAEMLKYRNFGRKSLQELVDILSDLGLYFGMDVDGIMAPRRRIEQEDAEGALPEDMDGEIVERGDAPADAGAGPDEDEEPDDESDDEDDEDDEEDDED